MKMIIAIVNRDDAPEVMRALTAERFQFTRISTTGGFLKAGNTTLMIGTDDDKINDCLDVIRKNSGTRQTVMPDIDYEGHSPVTAMHSSTQVTVGGATVFVMDVVKFVKM